MIVVIENSNFTYFESKKLSLWKWPKINRCEFGPIKNIDFQNPYKNAFRKYVHVIPAQMSILVFFGVKSQNLWLKYIIFENFNDITTYNL